MTEKNDSKWTSLATVPILGQAPEPKGVLNAYLDFSAAIKKPRHKAGLFSWWLATRDPVLLGYDVGRARTFLTLFNVEGYCLSFS